MTHVKLVSKDNLSRYDIVNERIPVAVATKKKKQKIGNCTYIVATASTFSHQKGNKKRLEENRMEMLKHFPTNETVAHSARVNISRCLLERFPHWFATYKFGSS